MTTETEPSILDARQPEIFFIEANAASLIPAVGSTAWTVYTLLVMHAAQSNGAGGCAAPEHSIANTCGLTEPELRIAIDLLAHHGLIEIDAVPQPDSESGTPVYRIVSARLDTMSEEDWARERDERMAGRRLFEALIDVCDTDENDLDDQTRRQLVAAVETIRSAGGSAGQVYDAALIYQEAIQGMPLTPRNLAMCWPMLVEMLPTDALVRST